MSMKIGFVGLGKMGLPMATRLANAGMDLHVISSNPASLASLVSLGAKQASGLAELAGTCDVLITIVPSDKEVLEIYTKPGTGIIDHASDSLICIEMSSIQGETMKTLDKVAQERGKTVTFLDAPVSGGVAGATAGTLTIMVGGDQVVIEKTRLILEVMGQKIIYTGDNGSASNVKMLNQILNAVHTEISSEVIALARLLDVDLRVLCDVVNESSGSSWIFKNNVPKFIIPRQHQPGFRLDLMKKDVSLVIDSARQKQAFMPVANLVYQLFSAAANQGHGQMNYTYIAEWLAENQPKEENT